MSLIRHFEEETLLGIDVGTATILKVLGRGNSAVVYVAFQRTLKRKIAVKIVPKKIMTTNAAKRFQQEAEAAAILSHPGIIPIYEVGETEEHFFMSMQLIQGYDLLHAIEMVKKHVLPSKRFLSVPVTLRLASQILVALGYAHSQDIVHRDIKPANILVEKHTKRPLISDFGVATFLRGDNENKGYFQGTPLFMAPEQITGKRCDQRADIYAAGVMLFQMLTSELPIREYKSLSDLIQHKTESKKGIFLKRPSEMNPNLHPDMDRIIQKALAYDPDKRFAACADFTKALKWYHKKHMT